MASKALTKPTFGFPSAEVIGRIGTWDRVSALHAAQSRYGARLSELEAQFEVRAAKLHESYLSEVIQIHSDDEHLLRKWGQKSRLRSAWAKAAIAAAK